MMRVKNQRMGLLIFQTIKQGRSSGSKVVEDLLSIVMDWYS